MEHFYPAGPAAVPQDLTKPTAAYRNRAWLAMGGLALFVALYLALAGWFTWTAWHLLAGAAGGGDAFWAFAGGVCAAFLAVFMWKALLFVQHRYQIDDIEVTPQQQPGLFAFLHRLADEAGAPRAHRVFLSPRVNAAVFYDLSVLNLFFPSKKNLEVGLALVNSLTLGEMKAVLAHEFGHFAQRSMAVGRWVYIAQQIAGHIIAKRDALDRFLRGLSRFDIRIAWVGWLLSLIIWSIRSLMETVFRIVVLAQRALSREMELQADLVSVSLTGSDALVHALHRLNVADEAWERALGFAGSEAHAGRAVVDLFEVQRRITGKLRAILDQPFYADVQPLPQERPHEHRIFKAQLAQAPRMWSTHPTNSEREQNAKRTYIAAAIDERSAWVLFENVPALKQQMSAHVLRCAKTEPVALEESLRKLDEEYDRAYLNRTYRGAYLGRSIARHATQPSELYNPPLQPEFIGAELTAIYPESLAGNLQRLRELEEEKASLQALRDGFLTAPGGVIQHRGRQLRRKDLPGAIEELQDELNAARDLVSAHDRRCRTAHLAAAAKLGAGWDAYLTGLARILHYAEHSEANLRDAQGALSNVIAVVTADGRVSKGELRRLILACAEAHNALRHVYEDEGRLIVLDRTLARRLSVENWQQALGEFTLPLPDDSNVNQWLQVIDGWIGSTAVALSSLRQAALEQLLLAESQVARFIRDGMTPGTAPEATQVPANYPLLVPGNERARQKKLDLWDRFHAADGLMPTLARLAVACGIVAAVVSVGSAVGEATINIYNGLGLPVSVAVGSESASLAPFSTATIGLPREEHYTVSTSTQQNQLIERFDVDLDNSYAHYIYNVAGASPLIEWTAVYGSAQARADRKLGAPRWTTTTVDLIFEEAPETISTKSGSGSRDVLSGFGNEYPDAVLDMLQTDKERDTLIAAHARWDSSESRYVGYWLRLAAKYEWFPQVIASRLEQRPDDALTLRFEQDLAAPQDRMNVCARHRSHAAAATDRADLQYIAARCIENDTQRDQAFADLYRDYPQNGWIAQAAGYTLAEQARWSEALPPLELARRQIPSMAEPLAMDIARIRRVLSTDGHPGIDDLLPNSEALRYIAALETGKNAPRGAEMAYYYISHGEIDRAAQEVTSTTEGEVRVLRLAAASDGASESVIRKALTLTPELGIDADSVWAALALALRERVDAEPYEKTVHDQDPETAGKILAFLDALRAGASAASAEQGLTALHLKMRGHAYSAGAIMLGARAPAHWRDQATRLLFVTERPYFVAPGHKPGVRAPREQSGGERVPPRLM